jgi:outer membrane protein OmpA-like peptidoglycan-associated protein
MVVIYSQANNTFSNPVYMGEEINNIGFNTTNGIVPSEGSEKLLIGNVTGNPKKVDTNVVLVGKDDEGNWTDTEEQKIRKSGIFNVDVDYHITGDGNALFIATERKNGMGGRDIYVSINSGNNKWGEPENLGNVINTTGDEYAPFYSVTENALYFASEGHGGMGGSDIFRVIREDESWTNWSNPENIGSDINTDMDEKYFYFDEASSTAYFARSKNDSVFGIYMVERPRFIDPNPQVAMSGRVTDKEDGRPIDAALSIFTMPEDQMYGVTFSDESTGLYNILLRSGYDYKLIGESEDYQPVEMSFTLDNRKTTYEYNLDLSLSRELIEAAPELQEEIEQIQEQAEEETTMAPTVQELVRDSRDEPEEVTPEERDTPEIQEEAEEFAGLPPDEEAEPTEETIREPVTRTGTKSGLDTTNLIRFNFNSVELVSGSFTILDAIARFLQEHDFIRLEIGGFTDHIGNEIYNVDLGRRRALAVKGYLTDAGITGSRIRIIGFGEKMPIILSTDIDELQTNRRVEFNFTK